MLADKTRLTSVRRLIMATAPRLALWMMRRRCRERAATAGRRHHWNRNCRRGSGGIAASCRPIALRGLPTVECRHYVVPLALLTFFAIARAASPITRLYRRFA